MKQLITSVLIIFFISGISAQSHPVNVEILKVTAKDELPKEIDWSKLISVTDQYDRNFYMFQDNFASSIGECSDKFKAYTIHMLKNSEEEIKLLVPFRESLCSNDLVPINFQNIAGLGTKGCIYYLPHTVVNGNLKVIKHSFLSLGEFVEFPFYYHSGHNIKNATGIIILSQTGVSETYLNNQLNSNASTPGSVNIAINKDAVLIVLGRYVFDNFN